MEPTARRFSIRRLAPVVSALFTLVSLLVAGALVWSTEFLERSVASVSRDTQNVMIASDVERRVLFYQRLANLYVVTRDEEADRTRMALGAQIRDLLSRGDGAAGAEEHALMQQASRQVTAFLEERERLDHSALGLAPILRRTQPTLSEALQSLEALRRLHQRHLAEASAAAAARHDGMQLVALSAACLLLAWLAVLVIGSRRLLLKPLLALHGTMRRFCDGDIRARAPRAGMLEVAQLAEGFNELAHSLSRQREDQLTFLAGVAHDLRNPLNGLKVGLQVLERRCTGDEDAKQTYRLERQVERLSRLVEDLLDATCIEAGQLELREEPFDLNQVVEDVIALYEPTSPQHAVYSQLPSVPMMVQGDPVRFEQVVSNLLSNAIKFSPRGGRIDVRVRPHDGEAMLEISDQGIGIPEEELTIIFLPFRRRKPDVAPGAGLGLSVVRHIVDAHRGHIEVESAPGRGTTVRVRVPLRHADVPIAATP